MITSLNGSTLGNSGSNAASYVGRYQAEAVAPSHKSIEYAVCVCEILAAFRTPSCPGLRGYLLEAGSNC